MSYLCHFEKRTYVLGDTIDAPVAVKGAATVSERTRAKSSTTFLETALVLCHWSIDESRAARTRTHPRGALRFSFVRLEDAPGIRLAEHLPLEEPRRHRSQRW